MLEWPPKQKLAFTHTYTTYSYKYINEYIVFTELQLIMTDKHWGGNLCYGHIIEMSTSNIHCKYATIKLLDFSFQKFGREILHFYCKNTWHLILMPNLLSLILFIILQLQLHTGLLFCTPLEFVSLAMACKYNQTMGAIWPLTLSTPIFPKVACNSLKFPMYSCSNFVENLTFLSNSVPAKRQNIDWQPLDILKCSL